MGDWVDGGSTHEERLNFLLNFLTNFCLSSAAEIVIPNPLLVGDCATEKLMGKIGPGTGAEANLGRLL